MLGLTNQLLENGITLFPNPTNDIISIFNKTNSTLTSAVILDVSGKIVKTINLKQMNSEIYVGISDLANGTYLITIEGSLGTVTKRIVKK